MRTKRFRVWGTVFCVLVLAACQGDKNTVDVEDAQSGVITVVGEIISIEDLVPADGGVTINLMLDNGEGMLLFFESFMVNPDENRLALYEVIKQVEVGNRVEATGLRKADGIELGELIIL